MGSPSASDFLLSTYKLILSYKGTHYFGWQAQPDQKTIQGELDRCLKKIVKSEEVKTVGSGRTDAGVHALAQVVRADIPLEIEGEKLLRGLNSLLPEDIKVIECTSCGDSFHPIHSALNKTYQYYFSYGSEIPMMGRELLTYYRHQLDIAAMQKAASHFAGNHDFFNYFCTGTPVKTTERTVLNCKIIPTELQLPLEKLDAYVLIIQGNGFLKQMVRLIMGGLYQVGRGKVSEQQIILSLKERREQRIGPVAPPQGLYLAEVVYPSN
jgi:tRNA pseudouridine38-40 synthase